MPGDYSRTTFKREKHYSRVLKQQGRVELDADDNEQLSIQHYRDETEAIDVIGQSGVPKKNDGFKIGIAPGGRDLTISPGRYYVDGLLCELDIAATYSAQPYLPNPASTTPSSPQTSPPSRQISLPRDGTYLVFLDAWQREVTALDDEEIREVALGGPDTAARLQNVGQVRLLEVGHTIPPSSPPPAINCKSPMPEFEQYKLASSGKLKARTQPPQPEESACLLPPGTGYNRLENQLYRIEVHTGGPLNQTRFKWSRDNASVETTITNIAGSVLTVADLGKDEILNFAPGQWVEIVDEESTLKADPHPLAQIDKIGPGPNEITLKTSAAAFANLDGLKLRRWDQTGASANANGMSANLAPWIELEGGIQVSFASGNYHAGDYWLIAARTATGQIEWPAHPINGPIAQSPKGIQHHYCRLALIQSTAGKLTLIGDCRKPFPTLTEICAVDVCFDNTTCDFEGAETVQDALDMLCRRHEAGQCTFVVMPGQDVQAVFNAIPPKGYAEVCFQVGDYLLPKTVIVEGKGDLKISGAGFGTRLRTPDNEAALKFLKCASVLIRDIYAETGIARAERGSPTEGLNGTLTFLNCKLVNVESVELKCASAPSRAATCVTVRNDTPGGAARVQHCLLELGNQQTGILLVNVARSQVEDNQIRVVQTGRLPPTRLLEDRRYRAGVRSLLIADARLGEVRGKRDKSNVTLRSGEHAIQFRTEKSLKKTWPDLLKRNPPTNIDSPRALLAHVVKLADRMLLNEAFRKQFKPFWTLLGEVFQQEQAVGSQGITVGGDEAAEVRIINNTIEGVLQGIHVGLSKRDDPTRHSTGMVTIAGNAIFIVLSPVAIKKDRHAIFVGNCDSLLIENNNARLKRLPNAEKLEIDGIHVWGKLGNRALVTQNHLASSDGKLELSFNIGINVHPLNKWDQNTLWRVSFNVAPSRQQTVLLGSGVWDDTNVPLPIPQP
jgi:Family of unknown function (DUF6519)